MSYYRAVPSVLVLAALSTPVLGSDWTLTRLNPAWSTYSLAYGAADGTQVGTASATGVHAIVWSGSASAYVDLNPPDSQSEAWAASQGRQVGRTATRNRSSHAALWSGTAESYVDLHPVGFSRSYAYSIWGDQQVGKVATGDSYASLWTGSADSWVNLNPAHAVQSVASGVYDGVQVGSAMFGILNHAGLWHGTAASWVDLNPAGAGSSAAHGCFGDSQVGQTYINGRTRASLWHGTAASWIDLEPAGATYSHANGIWEDYQVGMVEMAGVQRASVWSGTAGSWEDLSLGLPGAWTMTEARGVWSDGSTLYVAGFGVNAATGQTEALMWSRTIPTPSVGAALVGLGVFGRRRRYLRVPYCETV